MRGTIAREYVRIPNIGEIMKYYAQTNVEYYLE
jgi:hypothetical protein